MDKTILTSLISNALLAALAAILTFIGTHAIEIDPTWGPLVGTLALAALKALDTLVKKPATKLTVQAIKKVNDQPGT